MTVHHFLVTHHLLYSIITYRWMSAHSYHCGKASPQKSIGQPPTCCLHVPQATAMEDQLSMEVLIGKSWKITDQWSIYVHIFHCLDYRRVTHLTVTPHQHPSTTIPLKQEAYLPWLCHSGSLSSPPWITSQVTPRWRRPAGSMQETWGKLLSYDSFDVS